jgi:AbrB family looped-hinge helix DNA binding protein
MATKIQSSSKGVSKIGQRRQVVIPKDIFEAVGLKEGDLVEVTHSKTSITLKAKKLVGPEDTLTPEEERVVAKGFRQLKRGNYVAWGHLKDELGLKTIK